MARVSRSLVVDDFLEMFLAKLDLADHLRFSLVCKNWRRVATAPNTLMMKKPFSLVYSNNHQRLIRSLINSFNIQWIRARGVGSFEEWLVLELDQESFYLLNPKTMAQIQLPPFDSGHVLKAVVSSSPDSSSEKCSIVVTTVHIDLFFCSPGDNDWTLLLEGRELQGAASLWDMTFIKNQLYLARQYDRHLTVYDFNYGSDLKPTYWNINLPDTVTNLVNVSDKLMAIQLLRIKDFDFKVFEIDLTGNPVATEVECIGDNVIFHSTPCSFLLPAKDHQDFKANHVYENSGRKICSIALQENQMSEANLKERTPVFFTLFESTLIRND